LTQNQTKTTKKEDRERGRKGGKGRRGEARKTYGTENSACIASEACKLSPRILLVL
jgi:hypothetical protein